ncbi:hypothetical protein PM082_024082 [Marasmius tenuissimus]|nr:hypothetical protein PM082_024082 [Marasmius tenuissimus]
MGKAPRLAIIVPGPAVFAGPQDNTKQQVYFRVWQARCRSPLPPSIISNQVWKKMLYVEVTGVWPANKEPSSTSEHDHREASQL